MVCKRIVKKSSHVAEARLRKQALVTETADTSRCLRLSSRFHHFFKMTATASTPAPESSTQRKQCPNRSRSLSRAAHCGISDAHTRQTHKDVGNGEQNDRGHADYVARIQWFVANRDIRKAATVSSGLASRPSVRRSRQAGLTSAG
jgi:hypothetical protein